MAILVTGAAGFIGFHTSQKLLARGEKVVGFDSLNNYYDVTLKQARLAQLVEHKNFSFVQGNLADHQAVHGLFKGDEPITGIIHLAAQAGVRHSLTQPFDYVTANLDGHLAILEGARHSGTVKRLVYASSSSVYGGNTKLPFAVTDATDTPVSLYAATKKANELMGHCYAHLFGIEQVGLRFFTVYGPWGRPDMAMFMFTKAILDGKPIDVFNHGEMQRDFTYVDDIVSGVLASLDTKPLFAQGEVPHRVYNLGNHRSERLMDMIGEIEKALGKTAQKNFMPIQPGDVPATYADIEATTRDLGFVPTTPISVGVPKFVAWYRQFYRL